MKEVVAKKYVKALIEKLPENKVSTVRENLLKLNSAFSIDKFRSIIISPTVKSDDRLNFILSLVDSKSEEFVNFVKILNQNGRLYLIPSILQELNYQKALKDNIFSGKVFGNFILSDTEKKSLEDGFSKHFGSKITLETVKNDYNGIKIELDDLGVEISFSVDRLKAQMSEFILKAI